MAAEPSVVFDDIYQIGETLNKGKFSAVYECFHRVNSERYSVKIFNCNKIKGSEIDLTDEDTKRETLKLHALKHKHCVQLLETYSLDNGLLFTVNEFVVGKDFLAEILTRVRSGFVYSENVIAYYFKQIVDGLLAAQSLSIVHGNLNPNSILVDCSVSACPVKVIGFGYSIINTVPNTSECNGHYIAPELRLSPNKQGTTLDHRSDTWSLGALLYTFLSGYWMNGPCTDELGYRKLTSMVSTSPNWCTISEGAKDLVLQMLNPDIGERISLKQAADQSWLRNRDAHAKKTHLTNVVRSLQRCQIVRGILKNVEDSCLGFEEGEEEKDDEMALDSVLSTLINCSTGDFDHLVLGLQSSVFLELIDKHRNYKQFISNELHADAFPTYQESISHIQNHAFGNKEPQELLEILQSKHVQYLFRLLEVIVNNVTTNEGNEFETSEDEEHEELYFIDGFLEENGVNVRLVEFEKNVDEVMGITLKLDDDGKCLVSRVLMHGLMYRQRSLFVGDEIIEISGIQVLGQSVEFLQKLLRESHGRVIMKVIPSLLKPSPTEENLNIQLRASFDFDPIGDPLIPCPTESLGLPFNTGQVLKVVNKDDYYWWEAVLEDEDGIERSGLIPSPQLQEWRKCWTVNGNRNEHKNVDFHKEGKFVNKIFKSNGKRKHEKKYLLKVVEDVPPYEEVRLIEFFKRRTLILIGPRGIGRRKIKKTLISHNPKIFASPIPHTSRSPRKGREDENNYTFVSKEEMVRDISKNEYLEYGTHEGHLYGTRLSTIKEIICEQEKMAILDIEPQSVPILRTSMYAPLVVFISAPKIACVVEKKDDNIGARLRRESDGLLKVYRHLFDLIVINNEIQETVTLVQKAIDHFHDNHQWIPINWASYE